MRQIVDESRDRRREGKHGGEQREDLKHHLARRVSSAFAASREIAP